MDWGLGGSRVGYREVSDMLKGLMQVTIIEDKLNSLISTLEELYTIAAGTGTTLTAPVRFTSYLARLQL